MNMPLPHHIEMEVQIPMVPMGQRVAVYVINQTIELEKWFTGQGHQVTQLATGGLPAFDDIVAYSLEPRGSLFVMRLYIRDKNLATMAKLRWGGQYVA